MQSSMLIIGSADSTYGLNQILKHNSKKLVAGLYGDTSELTQAFNLAFDIGVKEIYLANVQTKTAYIDIVQLARQYNFTYIVPIGVRFADKAFNKQLNRNQTFAEIFLKTTSIMADSIIVMTDNHASLYEHIDHFLDDMFDKIKSFKAEAQSALDNGRQLWFVANNLEDVPYSNVILTAVMCVTDIPNYPDYAIPNAIFDIDEVDVGSNELIYFRTNTYANNSIENFVNFHNEYNAYKIATIDMVIRKINEDIDLTHFAGRLFNNQIKLKIQSTLQEYLDSITGKLIRNYAILSIESFLESDHSYVLVTHFKILPVNSLEECDVVIEV